jgi:hypothetical protein
MGLTHENKQRREVGWSQNAAWLLQNSSLGAELNWNRKMGKWKTKETVKTTASEDYIYEKHNVYSACIINYNCARSYRISGAGWFCWRDSCKQQKKSYSKK